VTAKRRFVKLSARSYRLASIGEPSIPSKSTDCPARAETGIQQTSFTARLYAGICARDQRRLSDFDDALRLTSHGTRIDLALSADKNESLTCSFHILTISDGAAAILINLLALLYTAVDRFCYQLI
jgi:hypothetical protein